MRLLAPNPGECADRQTILHLKIIYGGGKPELVVVGGDNTLYVDANGAEREVQRDILKDPSPINIQPFIEENESIQRYLEKNWFHHLTDHRGDEYNQLFNELEELNHQVWKLTDQAHILKNAPDKAQAQADARAAEVLYATVELNDQRAELVAKINRLFSISHREKIFA